MELFSSGVAPFRIANTRLHPQNGTLFAFQAGKTILNIP